jgi:SAM-dependent MidA family methyltransferase
MRESARQRPSTDDDRRDAVRTLLRRVASPDGFVPFDRFMEVALYGDGVGFYTRADLPFGREGDYYTAAHVTPLFGKAVAQRFVSALRTLPEHAPLRLVEVGPGDGTLGAAVVAGLASAPALRGRLEYVLVERSPALARHALEVVSSAGQVSGVPVRAAGGVGSDGPFVGAVLANEVLDAQPVRRLLWEGGRWKETGVRLTESGFERATGPCDRPVPAPELPRDLPDGTIVEVSPAAEALLREVADHLVAGLFVVLDYGMAEGELVAAHPTGTLAAVRKHRFVDDPLDDPGASDLSAFVNFTRVRTAARSAGFKEVAFRRQAEALTEWGFAGLLEEATRSAPSAEVEVRVRLAAKNLLFGFERFCALELVPALSAGSNAPAPLT